VRCSARSGNRCMLAAVLWCARALRTPCASAAGVPQRVAFSSRFDGTSVRCGFAVESSPDSSNVTMNAHVQKGCPAVEARNRAGRAAPSACDSQRVEVHIAL